VVITGGTGCRVHPTNMIFRAGLECSRRNNDPAAASRPFDADRDGIVQGEGAAAFIVESRQHAQARGATIQGRILGYASTFEPPANGQRIVRGTAIRASIKGALKSAELTAADMGHVNAHGLSAVEHDRVEAQAIRDALGDVPVTAPKSFFGSAGAGTGALEMAASVISFAEGQIPYTLNYTTPDPQCPINVVRDAPLPAERPVAMLLNQATTGQSIAVVIAGPE
jgi:3-oxoacyl-[acyl-carrier-protein] synthase II